MVSFVMLSLNPCCSGRWSRTVQEAVVEGQEYTVLILVVVDDGLVLLHARISMCASIKVLILVVVDDGLVLNIKIMKGTNNEVLILVVVDDGLVLENYGGAKRFNKS